MKETADCISFGSFESFESFESFKSFEGSTSRLEADQEFSLSLDANAESQRGHEVSPVVGDHHVGAGGARHFGNVRVVDSAAGLSRPRPRPSASDNRSPAGRSWTVIRARSLFDRGDGIGRRTADIPAAVVSPTE